MNQSALLNTYLPEYEFSEYHQIRINAPAERVFQAIKDLQMAELSPLVHLMFFARELPARLAGRSIPPTGNQKPMLDSMLEEDFILLEEVPDQEIVFGLIGEFWKADGGESPEINSPQEFIENNDPAFAKVAANLSISAMGSNNSVICSTETRIHAQDSATRRKFALYWRVISLGSALIRVLWLRAIKRRAER